MLMYKTDEDKGSQVMDVLGYHRRNAEAIERERERERERESTTGKKECGSKREKHYGKNIHPKGPPALTNTSLHEKFQGCRVSSLVSFLSSK